MMGYKTRSTLHERKLHQRSLVNVSAGVNILPEDVRSYTRPLQALSERDQNALLPLSIDCCVQSVCVYRKCSGRCRSGENRLRDRIRASGNRAVNHPLHRLGDTIHRLYRHRKGHRRRPRSSLSSRRRRHCRRHREPGCSIQLNVHRPSHQYPVDVLTAPAATYSRAIGTRYPALLRSRTTAQPAHSE